MERSKHTIDRAFLLAAITVFALGSLLVAVFGARQYQKTVDAMDHNHDVRTCSSYIREKIRQAGTNSTAEIIESDGITILSLSSELGDTTYNNYIYALDGKLYEILLPSTDDFSTGMGQEILDIESITFSDVNDSILKADIVLPDGSSQTTYIACKTNNQ
ncbi:MAG: DUF4860 domain-containing protein [Lachnospiraceae bacterium]|nr:DUF4860 domain-containing protein [Lachnospiraceae bacterium]